MNIAGPSQTLSVEFTNESSLPRGQACTYCRQRKIRCDGQRPVCGPCLRADRADECEYAIRSRADILEEDISRIESRIYELEHPSEAAGSSVSQMPSLFQVLDSPKPACTYPQLFTVSFLRPQLRGPHPPLDTFIPYASDWGFFLDITRFRRDVLLPHPIGHHSRPSPALLAVVYLIGIALNGSSALKAHEKAFLSRALSLLPVSLSGIHPRKAIHALQAEILLSNYFYAGGRFLEGRYHAAAAASLAVSTVLNPSTAPALRPDAEAVEDAERVDACWTTIILDRSWAVALATYPNLQDSSTMLDIPWPEDTSESSNPHFRSTVSEFLEGTEALPASMSPKTLLAKAVILWERANSLVVGWKPDMGPRQSNEFWSSFNSLDTRISDFQDQAGSAESAPHDPSTRRLLIVGRGIAHAATIQLHGTFAQTSRESKDKCLAAAKAILELTADADLLGSAFIHPIFSVRGFASLSN
ncbi:hypothetical protein B0H19DRAFT_958613 [Mycena capillaripes]|nr:hypothetical protein B0H19DRAFT_958613 [Mycena capillaripes]